MTAELLATAAAFAGLMVFYWQEAGELLSAARRHLELALYGFRKDTAGEAAGGEAAGGGASARTPGRARDSGQMSPPAGASGQTPGRDGPVAAVQRLLKATVGFGARKAAQAFLGCSFALGIAAFFVLKDRVSPMLTEAASVLAFLAPSLALLCRLQTIRIASSHEGDMLIRELLDNYRLNYFNMQQAIEATAVTLKDAENSRRLMMELSKGLNTAADPASIRKLLRDVRYSIGTSWVAILADNMYFALVSGIRVDTAMEDLAKTLAKARKVEEFARRENNESRLILKYLVPGFYAFTVFCGVKYFGLSLDEFLSYQFATPAGITWFTAAVLAYAAGMTAKAVLSRGRLDI